MSFKLKGIELDAFRIYQERELFNFQTVSGDVANLVVIYAPNGYGKTSFIDGVEWALTGDITRISSNSTIRNTADSEKGVILKNRHSDKEYGTVRIIAENGEHFEKNTKVLGRNGRKTDFADGDIVVKGEIFKDLDTSEFSTRSILGQDKIDSFLRSMTPRDRYDTLTNFWDDENDSELFKSILSMTSESEKKLMDVQKKIEEINEEIQMLVLRPAISSKINNLVDKFNQIKLRDFKLPSLDKDNNNNNEFVSLLIELNSKIDLLKSEAEENLTESKFLLDNYATFEDKKRELELIKKTIIEKKEILDKFRKKTESQNSLNITTYQSYELYKRYKKFKSLISHHNEYENLINEIKNKEEVIKLKTKETSSLTELKTNIEHKIKEIKRNIENVQTQKTDTEIRLSQFDANLQEYSKLKKDKIHYNKRLSQLKNLLDVRWDNKEKIKKEKTILESYFKYEVKNIYNLNNLDIAYPQIGLIVKEISNCLISRSEKQQKIIELEHDYDKFGKLNDQLNTIYKVGRKLIEDSHTNSCPLCKKEYEDFDTLIKNINKEFVEVDKLDKIRKDIETSKKVLMSEENKILKLNESFKREIDHQINDLLEKDIRNEQNIASCNHLKQKFDMKLANATDKEVYLISFFEKLNIDIEDYNLSDISGIKGIIKENISNLDSSAIKYANELKTQTEMQTKINNDLQTIESEIINNKNKARELKEEQTLKVVEELLEELHVSDDMLVINGAYQSLKNDFTIQLYNKRVISNRIDSLIKELDTYNKDEILEEFEANQIHHEEIQEYLDNFNVKGNNLFNGENNITISIISEKHSELTNENISLKTAFSILKELTEYTNYIENNIASKTRESKKKGLEEELDILKKSNEELVSAKQYVTSYIQNKINKTFNLDSINSIYQRIDPHPDLNNIKFETDFHKDKPELNIYASSVNEVVAPVLYFSAAQVNILSLSIFLAKALLKKNKGLNTIFMDDPIQHLDNLNILSFIDLLRTITNQLDKQIILSTHNENFYKLIKRKLDPAYTSSKFIELESFGKIRR
jgi:DNA repair protein SbcC/Rad50